LSGSGRLALKQYTIGGVALSLNAESFQVINTREYQATASGKLSTSGSLQEPFLRGGLTVRGSFRPDLSLLKRETPPDPTIVVVRHEKELAAARRRSSEKAEAKKKDDLKESPLYQRLGMDMTVQISRGTWIYLDEGSVEIAGELKVRKARGEDVSLAGTIEGIRGSYSFQGRRFRLEKARLVFTGGREIDPALDLVARYRLPEYEVDVVIGGTVSKPTLTFQSDPPLEQADILSVLLFGKPAATLSDGQQVALQAQALKTAANFIASDLRQSVARKVGLDVLEFDFGDQLSEGRVGIGKYVREDVFVSASQEFGEEKEQEVAIEYNITPNWQIRSSTTSDGESGIDIFWKKSY
jgi:translocation and assembly module TamB